MSDLLARASSGGARRFPRQSKASLSQFKRIHPPAMIENSSGIILRTRPLTETSLIVNWLTPELGRVATVAKGARRAKSPFAGKLDLFYTADFSFVRSRSSELHNLREVKLHATRSGIREDMGKFQQAAYAAACLEQATETETPLLELFKLVEGFLDFLGANPAPPQNIFALELKLLRELGLEPDFAEARLTPGAEKIVKTLIEGDWGHVLRLKLSGSQKDELGQFLHGFLIAHLGKLPRGRAMALA